MWSRNISFTDGELHLSGISASKLAKEFGTPAFFIDEADFRERAIGWNNALRDEFGSHAGTVYYAAKAFIFYQMLLLLPLCSAVSLPSLMP